jgi:hypothetical protein
MRELKLGRTLPLRIDFYPLSMFKFQMYQQMDENFRTQESMLGQSKSETDEFKRMLVETNPYLLAVTFLVSTLHSIFDFLAFKNDIQFWKNRKSMEGLSFRSILTNVVFQFIIFLYLFDNETSWMIVISTGVGLLIEIWKVTKAVDVEVDWSGSFPKMLFKDKQGTSKKVKLTQKYDAIAFKYMSFALIPCLIGYTIYSAVYQEHKGWYSFVVSTLVGFVYAFGFISMTPQLYINYKLKSVAHMPWKTFMYKALNTFIDDLFAFIIKMPWLHRIACFRDDVIFFIYLYQKWVYPVDHRRRNEFGQIGEEADSDDDPDEALLKQIDSTDKQNGSTDKQADAFTTSNHLAKQQDNQPSQKHVKTQQKELRKRK